MCILLYHPLYDGRGFSPIQESWKRYPRILELAQSAAMGGRIEVRTAPMATDAELTLVHSQEYLAWLRRVEQGEARYFDRSTPAWPGIYDRARATVGASVAAARLVASGESLSAINVSGGLHHAHAARASGFCLLNGVVVAVRVLQREFGLRRIAVVDIDGHHDDGTQALLEAEPVLCLSLHRHGGRFYPGTGDVEERGTGEGLGYTINVPLPRSCGDEAYLLALHEVVEPALCAYRPELIILQYGVDGHYADSMVRLGLSTHLYAHAAELFRGLAERLCGGRLVVVGGGGYRPKDAVRCWAMLLGELADASPSAMAHLHDRVPIPAVAAEAMEEVQGTIGRFRVYSW